MPKRPIASKSVPLTSEGKRHRSYVEDPLQKVIREKLEQLRDERLEFVMVGSPEHCTRDCWKRKAEQEADARALKALGDGVTASQFPLQCLKSDDEVDAGFRGYVLRCHCMPTPDESTPTE